MNLVNIEDYQKPSDLSEEFEDSDEDELSDVESQEENKVSRNPFSSLVHT